MFNNTTVIIIIILLLIIYLLDNIKELEDKILSKSNVKNKHLNSRKKYFQEILLSFPKRLKPENPIRILPAVLPIHVPSETYILPENRINIPSQDNFISGATAPGSTTMIMEKFNETVNPVYMNY